ncbi:MAG: hypothetical protein ACRDQA_31150 [Nocardioidaceae bacterium]
MRVLERVGAVVVVCLLAAALVCAARAQSSSADYWTPVAAVCAGTAAVVALALSIAHATRIQ